MGKITVSKNFKTLYEIIVIKMIFLKLILAQIDAQWNVLNY
jgi:hypothetical protein